MAWNFIESYQVMLNFLWEPIGVIMTIGAFFLIWEKRRDFWRDYRFWLILFGLVAAFSWRMLMHITGSRYFGVMVLPAVFLAFIVVWYPPVLKKMRFFLFAALIATCLIRDFWQNSPEERNLIKLFHTVKSDATKYPSKLILSFTESGVRETFYIGLPVYGVDRPVPHEQLLKNIRNNHTVFDGDFDAVYFILEARKKQTPPEDILPKNFTLVGKSFVDRHRKKALYIYRYLPGKTQNSKVEGELLPNGDFAATGSKIDESVTRRAVLFQNNETLLPEKWRIYHSLLNRSYAYASVVKTSSGNALHLKADNYIAVFSPEFELDDDRTLNFQIDAQSDCALQISQTFTDKQNRGMVSPVITLKIAGGTSRRYSIVLPKQENSGKSSVIFWLQNGNLNISDVRIK